MNKELTLAIMSLFLFLCSLGVLLFQLEYNEAQMEMKAEIQLLQGKVIRLEMIARELTK